MQELSPALAHAARTIATRLAAAGERAWIVGGAPRDLVLGSSPHDVDMASAATPEAVEQLFEHTLPLGRAFGTLSILIEGTAVQHTTFRTEAGYEDQRRPAAVSWGTTPAEDARRRDFTCNALYLDPLNEELFDPEGGLADMEQQLLRAVGDPGQRFGEDGLRLVRFARFCASLGFEPAEGLCAAARAARSALTGVSPERLLEEWVRILAGPRSHAALDRMGECGLVDGALPGVQQLAGGLERVEAWTRVRAQVLARLCEPPGTALGLAAILGPEFDGALVRFPAGRELHETCVERLRVSRSLRSRIGETWALFEALPGVETRTQAERRRALRAEQFPAALSLARAWHGARGADPRALDALERERLALGSQGLFPEVHLASDDLAALGVPRGPAWGRLLREAEDRALEGLQGTRAQTLAWLAARAQELAHEGGNTPRSHHDKG